MMNQKDVWSRLERALTHTFDVHNHGVMLLCAQRCVCFLTHPRPCQHVCCDTDIPHSKGHHGFVFLGLGGSMFWMHLRPPKKRQGIFLIFKEP